MTAGTFVLNGNKYVCSVVLCMHGMCASCVLLLLCVVMCMCYDIIHEQEEDFE